MKPIALVLLLLSPLAALGQEVTSRSVDVATGRGGEATGNRWAVVIGVSEYASPGIPDLSYAHRDAEAIAEFLQEEAGFDSSRVFLLTDGQVVNPRINATLARVRKNVEADDLVMFFFAGHGDVASDMGQAFLLTHDVDPDEYSINAYPTFMLLSQVRAIRGEGAHVILALDACRSGALAGGEEGRQWTHQAFADLHESAGDISFFMSSRASQISHEGRMWGDGHGVFTHFFLEGLRGSAVDFQNQVTLYDLGDYVEREVRRSVAELQLSPQIPQPLPADAHLELAVVSYPEQYAYEPAVAPDAAPSAASASRGDGPARAVRGPFWDALREGRLIPPEDSSAWHFYHQAVDAGAPDAAAMRDELYIALLLDADRLITRYLRGGDSQPGAEANRYAAAQLDHALQLTSGDDPERPWLEAKRLFLQARTIEEEGDHHRYEDGIASLRRSAELNPAAAYPHNALGTLLVESDRYEEAEAALREARRLSPTWELPQHNLGALREAQGRFEEAAAEYEHAVDLDPNTATSYLALAKLYAGPLTDPAAGEALATRIAERFRRDGLVDLPVRLPSADPEPLDVATPHGEPLRIWLPPYVDAGVRDSVRATLGTVQGVRIADTFAEADYYLEAAMDSTGYAFRRADSAPLQLLPPEAPAPIDQPARLAQLASKLARVKAWLTLRRPDPGRFPLEILGLEREDGVLFLGDSTGTLTLPPNERLCYTNSHARYRAEDCYRLAVGVKAKDLAALREASRSRYVYVLWVDHEGESCLLSPFAGCRSAGVATHLTLADPSSLRPYRRADGTTGYLVALEESTPAFNMRSGPFGRNLLALVTSETPIQNAGQALNWAAYNEMERRGETSESLAPGTWGLHRLVLDVVLGAEATPADVTYAPAATSSPSPFPTEDARRARSGEDLGDGSSDVPPPHPTERVEAPPATAGPGPLAVEEPDGDEARRARIQRWTVDLRPPPGAHAAFPLEVLGLQLASDDLVLRPDSTGVLTIPPAERPCYRASDDRYRAEDCYRLAIGLTPEARAAHDAAPDHLKRSSAFAYASVVGPNGDACLLLPFVGCRLAPNTAEAEVFLFPEDLIATPTTSGDSVWVAALREHTVDFTFHSEPYGRNAIVLLTTTSPFEEAASEMQWRTDTPRTRSEMDPRADPALPFLAAPGVRTPDVSIPDIAVPTWGLHRLHVDVVPGAPHPASPSE